MLPTFNTNTKHLQSTLKTVLSSAQNNKDALNEIADYNNSQVHRRFDTETDPSGAPWQPLSHKTLESRKYSPTAAFGNAILRHTGKLASSFTSQSLFNVTDITKNNLKQATTVPYAPIHQKGAKNIPKRPFLGINQNDADKILSIIQSHFQKNIENISNEK